jgi:hypothetical protein
VVDKLREYKQDVSIRMVLPWAQLVENLRGNVDKPTLLSGSFMNEVDLVRRWDDNGSKKDVILIHAVLAAHYARMILLYICGEHESAETDRVKYVKVEGDMSTYNIKFFSYVFAALNALALASKGKHVGKSVATAKKYVKLIKLYGKGGSVNTPPVLALIDAELLSLKGNLSVAHGKYDEAARLLKEGDFRLLQAITLERAGICLFKHGEAELGAKYMKAAWVKYVDHGVVLKKTELRRMYGSTVEF